MAVKKRGLPFYTIVRQYIHCFSDFKYNEALITTTICNANFLTQCNDCNVSFNIIHIIMRLSRILGKICSSVETVASAKNYEQPHTGWARQKKW